MMDFEKLFGQLLRMVKECRQAQEAYFRNRNKREANPFQYLQRAKQLEKQIDEFIKEFEGGQGRLFRD